MIKFGKPFAGWIKISIPNKEEELTYSASYLTDVPMDLLNGAIRMLEDFAPFLLEIDTEERGYYTIYNSPIHYSLYIINSIETVELEYIEPIKLAKTIYEYIDENKEVLYDWYYCKEFDKEEYDKYKEDLNKKLTKLKELLEKEEV